MYYLVSKSWLKPSAVFNRTTIIHMTIYVSRILNILFIMGKIRTFFIITLFARLCIRIGILFTCGKHRHNRIMSLRGKLNLPLYFLLKCLYKSRKYSGHLYVCSRGIDVVSSYDFSIRFWSFSDSLVFLFFISLNGSANCHKNRPFDW